VYFPNIPKSEFWFILEDLGRENFGMFQGHAVYFVVIWHMLGPFGIFCCRLVYFSHFGIMHQGTSGNPEVQMARPIPTTN
jgi:hypothetical protein